MKKILLTALLFVTATANTAYADVCFVPTGCKNKPELSYECSAPCSTGKKEGQLAVPANAHATLVGINQCGENCYSWECDGGYRRRGSVCDKILSDNCTTGYRKEDVNLPPHGHLTEISKTESGIACYKVDCVAGYTAFGSYEDGDLTCVNCNCEEGTVTDYSSARKDDNLSFVPVSSSTLCEKICYAPKCASGYNLVGSSIHTWHCERICGEGEIYNEDSGECLKPCDPTYTDVSPTEVHKKVAWGYTCNKCYDNVEKKTKTQCTCESPKRIHTEDNDKCYNCADENDPNLPEFVRGGFTCLTGERKPHYATFLGKCDDISYYGECLTKDACVITGEETADAVFGLQGDEKRGEIFGTVINMDNWEVLSQEKCTNNEGRTIHYIRECQAPANPKFEGELGKAAPGYNKKICTNNKGKQNNGSTEPVKCGNNQYFDTCTEVCEITDYVGYNTAFVLKGDTKRGEVVGKTIDLDNWEVLDQQKCSDSEGKTIYYMRECQAPANPMFEGELGKAAPGYNKKLCYNDKGKQNNGSTEPVVCGNNKYFDTCTETCSITDYHGENSVFNLMGDNKRGEVVGKNIGNGKWEVLDQAKCTDSLGNTIYYMRECQAPANTKFEGELGKAAPAYGLIQCTGSNKYPDPDGTTVDCGRYVYSSQCFSTCKYKKQEKDCPGNFIRRCETSDGQEWGECSK